MKYTLITGASEGIGKTFAYEFAKRKKNLILVARSSEKLKNLAQELAEKHKIAIQVIEQDLSKNGSAQRVFDACANWDIETLVNNAGFGLAGCFETQDLARLTQMIGLNIATLTELTHLFLGKIKKERGQILNVASTAAFQPIPYFAVYAATKAYVLHFSEALHRELKPAGVEVLALCPGATATQFFSAANMNAHPAKLPLQSSEEVVQAALDGLASKKSYVISGWKNRVTAFSTRLAPRSLVTRIAENLMGNHFRKAL